MLPLQLPWDQAQTKWKSAIDPALANVLLGGRQLSNIALVANTPLVVYHNMGQVPNGWFVTDIVTYSNVCRIGWSTTSITLEASANTTIAIWIY